MSSLFVLTKKGSSQGMVIGSVDVCSASVDTSVMPNPTREKLLRKCKDKNDYRETVNPPYSLCSLENIIFHVFGYEILPVMHCRHL